MTKSPRSDPLDAVTRDETVCVIPIRVQEDILRARQSSRGAAAAIGFGTVDQTRLATVVSELARNILTYAGTGECRVVSRLTPVERSIVIEMEDSGPGIDDIADAMMPGYSTGGGLGLGLPAVHKLMDHMSVETRPGRTLIQASMARRR
ncbi:MULTISPECIES: ATP-binding protein [Methylobacterium]|uniref:Serine/threonine-protein kinase RsbT n=1 Tax=Methylobacterium bullatum TaxID=570505 RepID=A0A679IXY8_9HYPH|nr:MULTISPECIES: ATP-binding protein [Methylobacterium]KQO54072.1 anti-sigma regulatory factor [Methylobacterium sp. Leaf85]MBD8901231.1 anti-sigma regulatory factor [Methylobacterium bullatum]GJD39161.1 Serine/threonine-protein kinase RsbT [Methylobacterium bullatum]CAA2102036.1 Serine/threonine-protein kinase RsbT [Methylobacterium bullatum]